MFAFLAAAALRCGLKFGHHRLRRHVLMLRENNGGVACKRHTGYNRYD